MSFSENRAKHSLKVAQQMYETALDKTGDTFYAQKMFHLGLVHDIGYQFTDNNKDHAHIGGLHLKSEGYEYWEEVYNHGDSTDAENHSPELVLLNISDLTSDSQGNRVTISERLIDIGNRYMHNSIEYRTAKSLVEAYVIAGYIEVSELQQIHKHEALIQKQLNTDIPMDYILAEDYEVDETKTYKLSDLHIGMRILTNQLSNIYFVHMLIANPVDVVIDGGYRDTAGTLIYVGDMNEAYSTVYTRYTIGNQCPMLVYNVLDVITQEKSEELQDIEEQIISCYNKLQRYT